jgi:hypothetical protein
VTCDDGLDIQDIVVTVTQHGGGALAQGRGHGECTAAGGQFTAVAETAGPTSFTLLRHAQVCAAIQIGVPGGALTSRQWCAYTFLLPENAVLTDAP